MANLFLLVPGLLLSAILGGFTLRYTVRKDRLDAAAAAAALTAAADQKLADAEAKGYARGHEDATNEIRLANVEEQLRRRQQGGNQ